MKYREFIFSETLPSPELCVLFLCSFGLFKYALSLEKERVYSLTQLDGWICELIASIILDGIKLIYECSNFPLGLRHTAVRASHWDVGMLCVTCGARLRVEQFIRKVGVAGVQALMAKLWYCYKGNYRMAVGVLIAVLKITSKQSK